MIKFIVFAIPFFLLDACFQIGPKFYYEIRNDSSYPIEIKVFQNGDLNETVTIEAKKSYIEKSKDNNPLSPFIESADSIAIVFNNSKTIIQYCEGRPLIGSVPICGEIEDNLSDFNFGERNKGGLFRGHSLKITFDDADYNRARHF